ARGATAGATSLVVAAVSTGRTLRPGLEAARPQTARHRVEVLLAAAADGPDVAVTDGWVRVIRGAAGALVPELWGAALLEARGAVVAVTITACLPDSAWLDAIATAHREAPADGIGG